MLSSPPALQQHYMILLHDPHSIRFSPHDMGYGWVKYLAAEETVLLLRDNSINGSFINIIYAITKAGEMELIKQEKVITWRVSHFLFSTNFKFSTLAHLLPKMCLGRPTAPAPQIGWRIHDHAALTNVAMLGDHNFLQNRFNTKKFSILHAASLHISKWCDCAE